MFRAVFTRLPTQPRTRSPQPFRGERPAVEPLEARDVPATAVTPGGALLPQLVTTAPAGQVSVQATQAPLVVNTPTSPSAFATFASLDFISALQSIAATDLSFNARTTEVRVQGLVWSNEGPVAVETAALSRFGPAGVETFNQQPEVPSSGAPPVSPGVVVANPSVDILSYLWVADQPPDSDQFGFLDQSVMPDDNTQAPADSQAPAIPPPPPQINSPIPLGQLDDTEPHAVAVLADRRTGELVEQPLQVPALPPSDEEDAAPAAAAALSGALLGFPGAAAAERRRREDDDDRLGENGVR